MSITKEELQKIVDLHAAWLGNREGGKRADLSGANLRSAKDADLAFAQTSIVPADGPIWGWKKCREGVLVKVVVGDTAKRSNASGRKCRAEHVTVLEVIGAEVGSAFMTTT